MIFQTLRIKLYGLDDEYVTDCENRLNAAIRQGELNQASDPQGNPGQPVKVLFVGGDELEKRNDAAVLKQLEKKAPWITADFEHTGWSGHWGPTADKITNRLGQYDALVITPYIRTGFGMTLRKNAQKQVFRLMGRFLTVRASNKSHFLGCNRYFQYAIT